MIPPLPDYSNAAEGEWDQGEYDDVYYGSFGSSHLGVAITPCATVPCDRSITAFRRWYSNTYARAMSNLSRSATVWISI